MKKSQQGFSLMQVLIALAVLVVIAVVAVVTLNPGNVRNESQDAVRVSDLKSIYGAIGLARSDNPKISLGSTTLIYLSLIDPTATSSAGTDCTYFGLGGGGYHCAASSSVYNIDGTGWVPVDFTKIGAGSSIQKLPIDPVNNATSGEFYAYATDGATSQLEAVLASNAAANSGVNNGQNTTPVFLYGDSNVDLPIVITSQQSSQTGFQPPSGYHNQLVITATAACGQSPFRCITSGSNGWELWWGTSVNTFAVIVHNTTLISTTTNYSGCGIGSCNYTGLDNSSNPFNLVYNNHTWYTHGCSGGRDYHCFSTAHASGTWTFSYSSASLNL